jgi:hypothetical protein
LHESPKRSDRDLIDNINEQTPDSFYLRKKEKTPEKNA